MTRKLTAREVAEKILPLSYRHILKMAKRGDIPAKQVGSSWLFDESELERWWQEGNMASRNHSRRSEERTA
jgi:excisionase family DNA binding protein